MKFFDDRSMALNNNKKYSSVTSITHYDAFYQLQFYLSYRKLKSGDILSLNCFPMVQGYYIALERTMFVHHATDAHLKYWDVNLATHIKGSKLIKPGVK